MVAYHRIGAGVDQRMREGPLRLVGRPRIFGSPVEIDDDVIGPGSIVQFQDISRHLTEIPPRNAGTRHACTRGLASAVVREDPDLLSTNRHNHGRMRFRIIPPCTNPSDARRIKIRNCVEKALSPIVKNMVICY